jgi:myosin heavy subunit
VDVKAAKGTSFQITFQMINGIHLSTDSFHNRWWKIREEAAGALLTKNFRMLIVLRRFNRAKNGTILLQSLYRGYATRRVLASIKIQAQYRMRKQHHYFTIIRSATIALQCRQRKGMATKVLAALKYEQKDIGKLKENNEKLKLEMASLKAMLAAEANSSATKAASEKVLLAKEEELMKLEKRIAELEAELEKEKEVVKKLEKKLKNEKNQSVKREEEISVLRQQNQNMKNSAAPFPPSSPVQSPTRKQLKSQPITPAKTKETSEVVLVERQVDPLELAQQKAFVTKLEHDLERERISRRNADGEVIRLRAEINGVKLNDDEVAALIPTGNDATKAMRPPETKIAVGEFDGSETDDLSADSTEDQR